jgi:aryl-alcohol dehydrogenase
MAASLAGCNPIVVVDRRWNRLELAQEVGATHVVDASTVDPVIAIRGSTGAGSNYTLEASGSPVALRQAVDALAPLGVCGVVGSQALGTEVSLDVTHLMSAGRVVLGIVQGDSRPKEFLPRLYGLWRSGKFPVERMMQFYDFAEIDRAAQDAESGNVIKPVLRMEGRE